MKIRFLIILFLSSKIVVVAQMCKFPDGVYLNLEQLKNQTPAYNVNLKIIQKTSSDKFWNGGNDYYFESNIDSIDKDYIRLEIFAYVKNDSIFINCRNYKLGNDYSHTLTKGNFLAFKTILMKDKSGNAALFLGVAGAIIDHEKNKTKDRQIFTLSLRTGNAKPLTKDYLLHILNENQNLLDQFNSEIDHKSDSVLLNYIDHLNQIVSPFSKPLSK